jgi:hypothetical protein
MEERTMRGAHVRKVAMVTAFASEGTRYATLRFSDMPDRELRFLDLNEARTALGLLVCEWLGLPVRDGTTFDSWCEAKALKP